VVVFRLSSSVAHDQSTHRFDIKGIDMTTNMSAEKFVEKLNTLRSPQQLQQYHRFFTFDEHNPDAGDQFIGVRMGQIFELAKEYIDMPLDQIERLLESPIHEMRAGACSIMAKQATNKKTSAQQRKQLYDLYLRRHDRINDWDLVDLGAYKVVGSYLFDFDQPRDILYTLARSENIWERRTAIVSTAHFIRHGDVDDTFRIAEILLHDDHDLVHKATGWMLRAAGGANRLKLLNFLDAHAAAMPRVALRYAIEHLDKAQREHYLKMKK
jgi:3-methyladenine DNA glycosylase AlkD